MAVFFLSHQKGREVVFEYTKEASHDRREVEGKTKHGHICFLEYKCIAEEEFVALLYIA